MYVTTSYFSPATQREVVEDAYPLVLVNGLQVAQLAQSLALKEGYREVEKWLRLIDAGYADRLRLRSPEEILADD